MPTPSMTAQTTPELDQRIDALVSRSYRSARPGFSLIELTAVLVIIGLLMAGAAVAVPGFLKRARVRTTKTSMVTIRTAINTYMADNAGDAPETILMLIPNYLDPGSDIDSWEKAYYYRPTPGAEHPFDLMSAGPDKEFQTADDISVWTMKVTSGE